MCDLPRMEEVKIAIGVLKNNKAAGPDNIPVEVIKADVQLSAEHFLPLIHKKWHEETCPPHWKNGHISILPKKGIMLTSVPGCILSRIILNRIKHKVDEKPSRILINRSTIDHITTLVNIIKSINVNRR